jgi:chromosome segregation ATPase
MANSEQPPENPAHLSDEEEEPELSFDNPLVVRIRDALRKQLEGVNEKVTADLRLQTEAVTRILKRREDVGVELYGVQQQLAKLQNAVEKAHDSFGVVVKVREQSEERKSTILSELSAKSHQLGEQKTRVAKLQGELDKLNVTLKQVEKYNDEMKGEIALNRRATYKAEEIVQGMERSKRQQDYELEELNAFILDLQKQLNLYSSQLEAQQKETASAAATLEEAAHEMDVIRTEKKALLQKWRSSLLQIERCDEQLGATEFATRQWKEKELAIDGEITSFRKSIKNEQEKNELLVGQVTKVRSEAGYLEKQIEACAAEHAQLTEQFNLFKVRVTPAHLSVKL